MKVFQKHIFIIAVLISFMMVSCEKVVHLDLNSAETNIVIEGNITYEPGPYQVMITTSGDYYTAEGILPISDAQVVISDDYGNTDTLTEVNDGIYLTNSIVGTSLRTYSVEVIHKDTKYSGSDYLPNIVYIDSLRYEEMPKGGSPPPEEEENKVYTIFCNFNDPPNTEDYYRLKIEKNGEYIDRRGGYYSLASDQLFNGQQVTFTLWGIEAAPDDTLSVILQSIGFNTYEYYRTLNDALSSGGMGGTPYNPISNLSNDALGYFGAFTSDTMSVVVAE